MKKIKVQLAAILLITSFLLFSCASDTVTNSSVDNSPKTIVVKVVDLNGLTLSNVYVSMNWGPGTFTGAGGIASFDSIKPPYDLMVYSKPDTIYTIYKDLTSLSPVVPLLWKFGANNLTQSAVAVISYPGNLTQRHESVALSVVSPSGMITEESWPSDSISYINFSWSGSGTERGSFCAMIDSGDFSAAYKYVGFAKRDTTFVVGNVYMIRLTANDFSFNPPEASVKLSMPPGTSSYSYSSSVSFNGMNRYSGFESGNGFVTGSQMLNLIVPGSMPLAYKELIFLNISFNGNGEYDYGGYFDPGANIQIQQPAIPQQINPPDHSQNIDYGALFSHNLSGGVYTVTFGKSLYSFGNIISVVTSSSSIYLPDISFWGFTFKGSKNFQWMVANNPGFTGVNDFASAKHFVNDAYYSIIKSQIRSFTTIP